jgi:hypothetical protein
VAPTEPHLTIQPSDPHRDFGVELFNHVWTLLEKTERSPADEDEMIHAAHAARFHWSKAESCRPENLARGEWQVSRVYAVLGRAEPADYHAQRCLEICREHNLRDFDLAYAYEAQARAAHVAHDNVHAAEHTEQARAAAADIADDEDRRQFLDDLATLPTA